MTVFDDLRALFEKRLAQGIPDPPGEFHPQDLDRLKDDRYLARVLEHCRQDLERSSKMLWGIMKWRKSVGASDIDEGMLRMDYLNEGTFFPHGRDLGNSRIIVVKCKNYVKGQKDFEDIKKIIIYWLDRLEREENGEKVTLFFDLDGCGLSNMDVELIRYMINLFSLYYPIFLKHIVVYQLPWMLTAAFKVVKKLLPPEAVAIMKFVNKDTVLKEIVSPEQALACWGGKLEYDFKFTPEKKPNHKKVTFDKSTERQVSRDSTISTNSFEDPTIMERIEEEMEETITIDPKDKITFKNEQEELIGRLKITNKNEKPVIFKIRTTAPEKFWVRPTSGKISPKKSEQILITVLPGYQKTGLKERFLVMATLSERNECPDIWKNISKNEIKQQRLRCQILENFTATNQNGGQIELNSVKTDLKDIKEDVKILKKDIIFLKSELVNLKFYQYLSIFLGMISVFLGYIMYKGFQNENMRTEL